MAIYHFSLKTLGRDGGKTAVASAAYISGTKLRSEETGRNYNYRKKKEVVFRHIFLPEYAPEEYKNRERGGGSNIRPLLYRRGGQAGGSEENLPGPGREDEKHYAGSIMLFINAECRIKNAE